MVLQAGAIIAHRFDFRPRWLNLVFPLWYNLGVSRAEATVPKEMVRWYLLFRVG